MTVTIVKEVFLCDVDLELPENPTQKDINEAVKEYLQHDDYDWDTTDWLGKPHMRVYDNYSGCLIYDSLTE